MLNLTNVPYDSIIGILFFGFLMFILLKIIYDILFGSDVKYLSKRFIIKTLKRSNNTLDINNGIVLKLKYVNTDDCFNHYDLKVIADDVTIQELNITNNDIYTKKQIKFNKPWRKDIKKELKTEYSRIKKENKLKKQISKKQAKNDYRNKVQQYYKTIKK